MLPRRTLYLQLSHFTNDVFNSINQRDYTVATYYIDMANTIDNVNHDILLKKTSEIRICWKFC